MTTLSIILFALFLIFGYLFLAPFYFEINTEENLYRIRFHKLASARILTINDSIAVEMKLAGWRRHVYLSEFRTRKKKTPARRKKSKKISWEKIRAVLKSFRINKCRITIDTGDMQMNGILFPLFFGISIYTGKNININFINENSIVFEAENSLARMSWAYLSS